MPSEPASPGPIDHAGPSVKAAERLAGKSSAGGQNVAIWLLAGAGVLVVLLVAGGIVLIQALIAAAHARMQHEECAGRLQRIATALRAYHDEYAAWPPAVVADDNGRPMHSWRVLILPHLGVKEEALYKEYHLDEPWNGPHNAELAERMPLAYGCPVDPGGGVCQTSYLALTDRVSGDFASPLRESNADTAPAAAPPSPFIVVEVAESQVNWLEPKDLVPGGGPGRWPAAGNPAELCYHAYHVGQCHVLADDLTVHEAADEEVRALLGARP